MRDGERSCRRSRKPVIAGGRSGMPPGPLKQTARDEQSGSHFHHHTSSRAAQRATLDNLQARSATLRAHWRWFFDKLTAERKRHENGRGF